MTGIAAPSGMLDAAAAAIDLERAAPGQDRRRKPGPSATPAQSTSHPVRAAASRATDQPTTEKIAPPPADRSGGAGQAPRVATAATGVAGPAPASPSAPATIATALQVGTARLAAAGIDSPRREARLLLGHALGWDQGMLLRETGATVDLAGYDALLRRREAHEPHAHIIGHREFWSLDFAVSPATLIPRPDSETVVEAALGAFPAPSAPIRVLDLGTGTGCLLLAVLHERPGAFGIGVDLSPDAAALAARNAAALGLAGRSAFLAGDWTAALTGRFDLVLSNPPYITTSAVGGLMLEVACFEPRSALDGGPDGADAYRRIIAALPAILAPEGIAVLEIGIGQAAQVADLAAERGLAARTRADLAGIARAIVLKRRSP